MLYRNLIDVIQERSAEWTEKTAYIFLSDGEIEGERLSYAGLDRRARAIGARLQELGATGEPALLLYPPGLDFVAAFFGCLYAGAIAVPAYPPKNNREQPRLAAIAGDARPRVVLTSSALPAVDPGAVGERIPALATAQWLATDRLDEELAALWRDPGIAADGLALLQYTSGSTATPKGVLVSHANLLANQEMIRSAFGQTAESVVVGWLPLYHDMGLIGNVLQPFYVGGSAVLLSPQAFLQRPARWLRAISRYRATTSGGPNFAYDLCVRRVGPAEREGLDLSSWRVAFSGAEPVRGATLSRFAEAFAPAGFRRAAFFPCYGLAEATLFVAGGAPGEGPAVATVDAAALERREVRAAAGAGRELVDCGVPRLAGEVVIADPESGLRCPPDRVGEIWVAGPHVAGGYRGRPEESARDFHARLLGEPARGPYLRTGDLGFERAGRLFVTGRLKDLLIVRGRNLYPQDLEETAERAHPALRPGCGAAFAIEVEGEERVVLACEVERGFRGPGAAVDEVAEAVRRAVALEHEVAIHELVLLRVGTVPKTSSGKIQRGACRAGYLAGTLVEVGRSGQGTLPEGPAALPETPAPADLLERLRQEVARAAGVPPSRVDPEAPLAELGLDSLAAIELGQRLEDGLGVRVELADLLLGPTLTTLAGRLREALAAPRSAGIAGALPAAPRLAESPLSHGQHALWLLHRLAPESPVYNLAGAALLRSEVDASALHRACRALVARHPVLRATYHEAAGEPVQRIGIEPACDFREEVVPDLEARLEEEAYRPFDLAAGPLLRVALFKPAAGGPPALLLAVHHIAADLWSMGLLLRELGALYAEAAGGPAADLPPSRASYTDYVAWQRARLAGPEGERLWSYWRERLAGPLPVLDLPADRPRPPAQSFRGAALGAELDAGLAADLKALARAQGATLYMVLLAGFAALLRRYTGQENLLVGSPTAGRGAPELAGLVGYLVNPVALRMDLTGDPPFSGLLDRVRQTALAAFAHQDYPFPLLAERLRPERDPSRSPLFQVMFVLQAPQSSGEAAAAALALRRSGIDFTLGGARGRKSGLALTSLRLLERSAPFDLTLSAAAVTGDASGLALEFQYGTDLFDSVTARRLLGHLGSLLAGLVADPGGRVADLPLLASAERQQLSAEWNDTAASYPSEVPLQTLIAWQAERTPEAVAVSFGDERLSYRELALRSNRLARHLQRLGVGPEVRVGICAERSAELIWGLLGILVSGGAYVPLDPGDPAERLAYLVADARVPVLLTQERLLGRLPETGARKVLLDAAALAREDGTAVASRVLPENLAYVIYTSGSTGRPKGAMNSHRAISNRVLWMQSAYGLGGEDRVLQKTPASFDVSVWEFFWPLATGAGLVVARPGGHRDSVYLLDLIAREGVTTLHFVPSLLQVFLEEPDLSGCASLRRVMTSGEALAPEHRERFLARLGAELHNLYGPTEAAVDVTSWRCREEGGRREVPIGRPIGNLSIHLLDPLLDQESRPVPVGVPGHLHIAGVGLARGYLERPDLTADRFRPDGISGVPGGRLYRTGDLARHRPDGAVEFLGRLDHQVKLRGFRIELGEIETALREQPGVGGAVVVLRDFGPGDRRLVAYVVPRRPAEVRAEALRGGLLSRLPEPMVPVTWVILDSLPLTASGKVDRRALPAPLVSTPSPAAPRTPVEERLASLWSELLGGGPVGAHDSFFERGGSSLKATQLRSRIRTVFGVDLPLATFFAATTVAAQAERIERSEHPPGAPSPPISPVLPTATTGEGLPLSSSQMRLWLVDQMELGSPFYNIAGAVRLTGPLQPGVAGLALAEIVRRHEVLRTSFVVRDGHPAQLVESTWRLPLPMIDLRGLPALRREEQARRLAVEGAGQPFDLARAPLLRCRLLRLAAEEHVLTCTVHHIVSDWGSLAVLVRELAVLYEALASGRPSPLPELPLQYRDFALRQREQAASTLEDELAYWRERLAGAAGFLRLPIDHPRPARGSYRGRELAFALNGQVTEALRSLGAGESCTLFMVLVTGFQALLRYYTRQDDIVLSAPLTSRDGAETEGLIGFFVDTLLLRTDLGGDPSFRGLLARVRATILGAYAHRNAPLERVMEEIAPVRSAGHDPFLQVGVNFLDLGQVAMPETGGLGFRPFDFEVGNAQFELNLLLDDAPSGLRGKFNYKTELFERETIAAMADRFCQLLTRVAALPDARLNEIEEELTREDESRRLAQHGELRQSARLSLRATRRQVKSAGG
jgi:amino acid adenylation domain-containing protein